VKGDHSFWVIVASKQSGHDPPPSSSVLQAAIRQRGSAGHPAKTKGRSMTKKLAGGKRASSQLWAAALPALVICSFAPPCKAETAPNSVESKDWPLLGRDAYSQGFSPLKQVHSENASQLGLAWSADIPIPDGMTGEPLVKDGVVYQGGTMGMVFANDLKTGKLLWKFAANVDYRADFKWGADWGTRTNRGLALWDNAVIDAVGDCRLIALDSKTGNKLWETQSCDPSDWETHTAAPRVGDGKVFMGIAISEYGSHGHLDAYDARTGKRLWRFYTVPVDQKSQKFPQSDPEAMASAAKTWGKDYTPLGGAPWEGIVYDPETKLVVFGTGEPKEGSPLQRGRAPGDELYTNSIVALHADTGKLAWYFKQTPADAWNYDATDPLMIADLQIDGQRRHVVMQAPKNGFFYVLDATNGKFISAKNIVPVVWASKIDANGRPVQRKEAQWYRYPDKWTLIQPNGPMSGAHWPLPMSYCPLTNLVYIPAANQSTLVKLDTKAYMGGVELKEVYAPLYDKNLHADGMLIAWDPSTQRQKWQWNGTRSLVVGGTLATAGNLVFAGTGDGVVNAFAADTGKVLWSFETHQCIESAPVTVESEGRQLILVASGNCASGGPGRVMPLLLTKNGRLPPGPSRLLAFELGGKAVLPPVNEPGAFPKPPLPPFPLKQAQRGEALYNSTGCQECHGASAIAASGGTVPDLRKLPEATYSQFKEILFGAVASLGMPSWKEVLTAEDTELIKAYVINKGWDAYEAGGAPSPGPVKAGSTAKE